MRLARFRALVEGMTREVPAEFLEGVAEVHVSAARVPHPTRADIYTLGECIPLPAPEGEPTGGVQSRVVLYHGSFEALSGLGPGFDWRAEAWDTLTHELRHHLEWRAGAPDLEAFDEAAEQNFARQEGDPFDPLFHLHADEVAEGVYRVDDDWFLDRVLPAVPPALDFAWHGRTYRVDLPPGLTLPVFVAVRAGVTEPPPGDLVVVLRRRATLLDLFRRAVPPTQVELSAIPLDSA